MARELGLTYVLTAFVSDVLNWEMAVVISPDDMQIIYANKSGYKFRLKKMRIWDLNLRRFFWARVPLERQKLEKVG